MHAIRPSAAFVGTLLCLLADGCCESGWRVPYAKGERPSKLWSEDPRTRGWGGVDAAYCFLSSGEVDATVRSADGRHRFKQRGELWYEDDGGRRFDEYVREGLLVVVRFGDREERYRSSYDPRLARQVLTVIDAAPSSPAGRTPGPTPP